MKIASKTLFDKCYGRYAVPAVNVEMLEQILPLFATASAEQSPLIVQTTPAARNYGTPEVLVAIIEKTASLYPDVVYALHVDHGVEDHIHHAIDSGWYTSVMIDASHDPLEANIERTKLIVDKAHQQGISVEAELGVLSGKEDDLVVDDNSAQYTDPEEAEIFVSNTGCDCLAVAVGTSHGAYKFSGGEGIQFGILEDIRKRLGDFPIVLHGGSTIDQDEIRRINEAGGTLKSSAKGVHPDELQESIKQGVCKVNIATDTRILWTRVAREYLRDHSEDYTPMNVGLKYMEEYPILMKKKFQLLGSAGKAKEFLSR